MGAPLHPSERRLSFLYGRNGVVGGAGGWLGVGLLRRALLDVPLDVRILESDGERLAFLRPLLVARGRLLLWPGNPHPEDQDEDGGPNAQPRLDECYDVHLDRLHLLLR